MRKKSRLFAIAEYLRGRRTGITAEALAERFGVTVRTIYRDLDALKEAELPLAAERGRGGGYALDRAYSLPPVNFSPREAAVVLTIGKIATELRWIPFTTTLGSALDKVRGALGVSAQREMMQLVDQLQFVGVPSAPVLPAIRRSVEQAWFENTPLKITYRNSKGETEELEVKLLGVLIERTFTLLDCQIHNSDKRRSLRLDRIDKAKVITR